MDSPLFPCEHVLPGGESWTSPCGLAQLVVFRNESSSVSGGSLGKSAVKLTSSLFCVSKPLFWFFGWLWGETWSGGKPICGGAPSIANFGECGLQPIMCCKPARSDEGLFLAISPGFVAGSVTRFVSGSVARCFCSGV